MPTQGDGPADSEKMGSNKTRAGSSCGPVATHGNSTMKLWMYASKGISVKLDGTSCRRTAWPSHVALRLGSESVEVEVEVERTPQSGLTTLTGGWGWVANASARTRSNVGIWKLEGNAGQ